MEPLAVIVAGMFLGVAWAAIVPVGIALFFEKSSSKTRGIAMGAYNFAVSMGAACGAILASLTAAISPGYMLAMLIASFAPLAALPYVLYSPSRPVARARLAEKARA